MSRAWIDVDLDATRANVRLLRAHTGRDPIAVVKANAYGHGAVRVGRAALEAGARALAVATVDEARELREALGPKAPLLILGAILEEELLAAAATRAATVVHSITDVERLARVARSIASPLRVHVEVDSGLARHGAAPEDALAVIGAVLDARGLVLEGVMTHLACAADRAETRAALDRFDPIVSAVRERAPGVLVHAAASTAALLHEDARYDACRPGIALHGLDPDDVSRGMGLRLLPTLSLKARVTRVREVEAGTPVGYGATWKAPRRSRLAVVGLGYDDGLPYKLSNMGTLLVRGVPCPIVGTVMMDYVVVDATDVGGASAGDVATAIGRDGAHELRCEDVARSLGVIPYTLTCGLGRRIERVYTDASEARTAAPIVPLTASQRQRRAVSG